MDYTGKKFMQKCGDFLIIDKKSNKKIRNRYYWEAHFEGYDRILYVRTDSFKGGTVGNPDKPDEYVFLCDVTDVDKKLFIAPGIRIQVSGEYILLFPERQSLSNSKEKSSLQFFTYHS